jgi:hypothetical protein
MVVSNSELAEAPAQTMVGLWPLVGYFLKLGTSATMLDLKSLKNVNHDNRSATQL